MWPDRAWLLMLLRARVNLAQQQPFWAVATALATRHATDGGVAELKEVYARRSLGRRVNWTRAVGSKASLAAPRAAVGS